MSNYTKSTDFTSKDSLPSGDALKIVKGAEFDTEFNAIATAISTKYDSSFTIPLTSGGTGATTASAARTNLGVVIGTNVQAWDADLDTWSGKTAPSGTVVGTTDTQTLTNKTLTSPTVTSPTVTGAVMSSMASSVISSATAVASTSGTSIDFTSIPSWVKRITVMFNGVSTSGSNNWLIQLGSGSVTTSGYISSSSLLDNVVSSTAYTNGIGLRANSSSIVVSGLVTLALVTGNQWVASGTCSGSTSATSTITTGGSITIGGALDRVRITTVGGTDTFDAGSINILYE